MEAGLDSLGAVELRNSLSSSLHVDLPATVIFDFPTIKALAGYLKSLQPETGAAMPFLGRAAAADTSIQVAIALPLNSTVLYS